MTVRLHIGLILFLALLTSISHASPISILVAGDVNPGRLGAETLGVVAGMGVGFANLEMPIVRSGERRGETDAYLKRSAAILSAAGVRVVSMANNHCLDRGADGLTRATKILGDRGIRVVGAGMTSQEARAPVVLKVGGREISVFAASAFGPFAAGRARVNNLADAGLVRRIEGERAAGRLVLVSLHWGQEYTAQPTEGQRALARRLIDAGAEAIIGHHPHVRQPIEYYRSKPIAYSLGDLVGAEEPLGKRSGSLCALTIGGDSVRLQSVDLPIADSVRRELAVQGGRSVNLPASDGAARRWSAPAGETIVQAWCAKLAKGRPCSLVVRLSRRNGLGAVRVLDWSGRAWLVAAESVNRPIWRMEMGDVNADGLDEIVVGLNQRSKLDLRVAKRLYVYAIDAANRAFLPLWRGSSLSRPFRDYRLLECGGRRVLVAIETAPPSLGCEWLSVYSWDGFGFVRRWDTPVTGRIAAWGSCSVAGRPESIWVERVKDGRRDRMRLTPGAKPGDGLSARPDAVVSGDPVSCERGAELCTSEGL